MGNPVKSAIFWAALLGLGLMTVASGIYQRYRTEDLKRALADQHAQFDRESSYVVRTAEETVLSAAKIQGEAIAFDAVDEHGVRMDANAMVGEKGIRFLFVASRQNCGGCLEKELLLVQRFFSEAQKSKTAFLLDMPNARDRRIFSEKYGVATYHLAKDDNSMLGPPPRSMLYLTVREDLSIRSVYIPVSFLPGLSEQYIRFMASKI